MLQKSEWMHVLAFELHILSAVVATAAASGQAIARNILRTMRYILCTIMKMIRRPCCFVFCVCDVTALVIKQ